MFKLCDLTRWDINFCVRTSPLRGRKYEVTFLRTRGTNPVPTMNTRHKELTSNMHSMLDTPTDNSLYDRCCG